MMKNRYTNKKGGIGVIRVVIITAKDQPINA